MAAYREISHLLVHLFMQEEVQTPYIPPDFEKKSCQLPILFSLKDLYRSAIIPFYAQSELIRKIADYQLAFFKSQHSIALSNNSCEYAEFYVSRLRETVRFARQDLLVEILQDI